MLLHIGGCLSGKGPLHSSSTIQEPDPRQRSLSMMNSSSIWVVMYCKILINEWYFEIFSIHTDGGICGGSASSWWQSKAGTTIWFTFGKPQVIVVVDFRTAREESLHDLDGDTAYVSRLVMTTISSQFKSILYQLSWTCAHRLYPLGFHNMYIFSELADRIRKRSAILCSW